ncbi:MAG TPA: hypothetical protein DDZ39_01175 [Flavobacteriaceae bacterium]|jgi:hypothetical protein|nr:hypothetical protein [Flavobacteriaceae bacterium]HBS12576.1 hypothetical protein [Flavobacteriaceae bacterium]
MRKLSYLIAVTVLSLISTATFAQDVVDATETNLQEKVEIQAGELPEAVTNALTSGYTDYTVGKAFKATHDGQEVYYVQLAKAGATSIEVLFDTAGKIIEQKDLE